MYLLWHCDHHGWVTKSGSTTTVLADAARMSQIDAISRTRDRRDYNGDFVLLPVAEADLKQALAKEGKNA